MPNWTQLTSSNISSQAESDKLDECLALIQGQLPTTGSSLNRTKLIGRLSQVAPASGSPGSQNPHPNPEKGMFMLWHYSDGTRSLALALDRTHDHGASRRDQWSITIGPSSTNFDASVIYNTILKPKLKEIQDGPRPKLNLALLWHARTWGQELKLIGQDICLSDLVFDQLLLDTQSNVQLTPNIRSVEVQQNPAWGHFNAHLGDVFGHIQHYLRFVKIVIRN